MLKPICERKSSNAKATFSRSSHIKNIVFSRFSSIIHFAPSSVHGAVACLSSSPQTEGFHGVKLGTLAGGFEAVLPLFTIAHRHIEPAIRVRTCLKFNSTQ
jgi:hypothetical protein